MAGAVGYEPANSGSKKPVIYRFAYEACCIAWCIAWCIFENWRLIFEM